MNCGYNLSPLLIQAALSFPDHTMNWLQVRRVRIIRVSQPSSTSHAIFVLRHHHWLRGNTVLLISNLPSHEASPVLSSYHLGMELSVVAHACHLIRLGSMGI
jgi:hypothetical protein